MSRLLPLVLVLALCLSAWTHAAPIAESLVRIEATSQEPDYKSPWSPGTVLPAWERDL